MYFLSINIVVSDKNCLKRKLMIRQRYFLLLLAVFIFTNFGVAKDMDSLLSELARKDDLSQYTKKDTAGFIKIFTREDLDRMKIRSYDELIDKIPFLRNKLDNLGLNDPYYEPYQINNPSRIRLFINDREILTPLFGSAMRLLGQIDISYIDHIEVYHGVPSYEISIEPSVVVMKAYTKIGKRENTTTVGTAIGSHSTYDAYVYKSEKLDKYSYFVYANHRDLNRNKIQNNGIELSRDKETMHVYGQVSTETSNFEIQAVDGTVDNFTGTSYEMSPTESNTDFKYFSSSYSYLSEDKSLKATFNYTYLTDEYFDSSILYMRLAPTYSITSVGETITNIKTTEHLFDSKITKKYKINDTSILLGLSNRFKKFNYDEYEALGPDIDSSYDTENIVSIFTEINQQLNENNQLILSLNGQKYFENTGIDDDIIYGVRLGHIYNKGNLIQKSFLYYGKFHPTPLVLLLNDSYSNGLSKIDSETAYGISTQSLWKINDKIDSSLLLSRTVYKDGIYFNPLTTSFHNDGERSIFDTVSFETQYSINSHDKIDLNIWTIFGDGGKSSKNRYQQEYGGSLSLYTRFSSVDIYNSISYVSGKKDMDDGWNYNATISYEYSKNLTLFLKGKNLLDKALVSNYTSGNPYTGQMTELNNIANIDRTVWFGLEYQF